MTPPGTISNPKVPPGSVTPPKGSVSRPTNSGTNVEEGFAPATTHYMEVAALALAGAFVFI